MLITYQMESLEELLESITYTLQSQYSSRFIRLANPMALNATPEVLDLNIYAICSLWLSDALSENALDGDPVVDTEVASTFLGFAKLFLEGPYPLLVHWAEVLVGSEEHTSALQSHSEISYAVFCLKKKSGLNLPRISIILERYRAATRSLTPEPHIPFFF